MKSAKKQFLVVGLGRFGRAAAIKLCELGHEVMAVDDDAESVESVAPYVTEAVQLNAADEEAMSSIGIRNYDAAIVAMGSDMRSSILVSVLCKEAGIPLVIAKATDELHGKVLTKIGVDRVIYPERDSAQRLAASLVSPNLLDMIELSENYSIAESAAPAAWIGKTLIQLNVRRNYGISVIAARRGSEFIASPGADFQVMSGDILVLLGNTEDISRVENK